jgi:5'-methylthioinosine phosphorylase
MPRVCVECADWKKRKEHVGMIGIIGGTGLDQLAALDDVRECSVETPWGMPSAPLRCGRLADVDVVFLARHGDQHQFPPHAINYRANLWALREQGVTEIIAVAAVGGIHADFPPAAVSIPDQIVDYTSGRESTFYTPDAPLAEFQRVEHVDFSWPYDANLRQALISAARELNVPCAETGVYGATNGPRLETAAEIHRMAQDGCTMVGMTGMPEAVLARELGIAFAMCAVSANWGAGLTEAEITMEEIHANLKLGMQRVISVIRRSLEHRAE